MAQVEPVFQNSPFTAMDPTMYSKLDSASSVLCAAAFGNCNSHPTTSYGASYGSMPWTGYSSHSPSIWSPNHAGSAPWPQQSQPRAGSLLGNGNFPYYSRSGAGYNTYPQQQQHQQSVHQQHQHEHFHQHQQMYSHPVSVEPHNHIVHSQPTVLLSDIQDMQIPQAPQVSQVSQQPMVQVVPQNVISMPIQPIADGISGHAVQPIQQQIQQQVQQVQQPMQPVHVGTQVPTQLYQYHQTYMHDRVLMRMRQIQPLSSTVQQVPQVQQVQVPQVQHVQPVQVEQIPQVQVPQVQVPQVQQIQPVQVQQIQHVQPVQVSQGYYPAMLPTAPHLSAANYVDLQDSVNTVDASNAQEFDTSLASKFLIAVAMNICGHLDVSISETQTVELYIRSLLHATHLSKATLLMCLVILNRVVSAGIAASNYTLKQLITGSFVLANKFNDDNTFTNASWSMVTGIPTKHITALELSFLTALGWCFNLNDTNLAEWKYWEVCWQEYELNSQTCYPSSPLSPMLWSQRYDVDTLPVAAY